MSPPTPAGCGSPASGWTADPNRPAGWGLVTAWHGDWHVTGQGQWRTGIRTAAPDPRRMRMEPAWAVATALRDEPKLLVGIAERPNANPALAVVSSRRELAATSSSPPRRSSCRPGRWSECTAQLVLRQEMFALSTGRPDSAPTRYRSRRQPISAPWWASWSRPRPRATVSGAAWCRQWRTAQDQRAERRCSAAASTHSL